MRKDYHLPRDVIQAGGLSDHVQRFAVSIVVVLVVFLLESKAHPKFGFGWAVQFGEDFKLGMDFKINFHPH